MVACDLVILKVADELKDVEGGMRYYEDASASSYDVASLEENCDNVQIDGKLVAAGEDTIGVYWGKEDTEGDLVL